ncbi:MAG: hypothetical protein KGM96_07125 [Acidobacteriota bacterium]|nr:hypothetical protein [Acidobacteriota bacterium]
MSNPQQPPANKSDSGDDDGPNQGPNLVLLYSIIAIAMAAAIGFALLIVLPFYHRR